jgi:hypothetical protein
VKELEREKARLEFEVRPLQENLRILEGQVKDQQARLKETALDKNKVRPCQSQTSVCYLCLPFS